MSIIKLINEWKKENKLGKVIFILQFISILLFILRMLNPPLNYPVLNLFMLTGFIMFILLIGLLTHYANSIFIRKLTSSIISGLLSLLLGFYFYGNIRDGYFNTASWMLLFLVGITWLTAWLLENKKAIITSIMYNTVVVSITLLYYLNNLETTIYQTIIVFLLSTAQLSNHNRIVAEKEKNRIIEEKLLAEQQARELAEKNAKIIEEKLLAEQQAREAKQRENLVLAERNKLLEEKIDLIQQAQEEALAHAETQIELREQSEAKIVAEREKRQAVEAELEAKKEAERYNASLEINLGKNAKLRQRIEELEKELEIHKKINNVLNGTELSRGSIYGTVAPNSIRPIRDRVLFYMYFDQWHELKKRMLHHRIHINAPASLCESIVKPKAELLVSGPIKTQEVTILKRGKRMNRHLASIFADIIKI